MWILLVGSEEEMMHTPCLHEVKRGGEHCEVREGKELFFCHCKQYFLKASTLLGMR